MQVLATSRRHNWHRVGRDVCTLFSVAILAREDQCELLEGTLDGVDIGVEVVCQAAGIFHWVYN